MAKLNNDTWHALFDSWADEDPQVASTGGFTAPWELAALAYEIGDCLEARRHAASPRRRLREWVIDGTVGAASGRGRRPRLQRTAPGPPPRPGSVPRTCPSCAPTRRRFRSRTTRSTASLVSASCSACRTSTTFCERSTRFCGSRNPDCRIFLGSLPDAACKSVFFDHCDSLIPWYRRMVPRAWRWRLRRLWKPDCQPGETQILWFEPEELAATLRQRGVEVDVVGDPEFSNYGGLSEEPGGQPGTGIGAPRCRSVGAGRGAPVLKPHAVEVPLDLALSKMRSFGDSRSFAGSARWNRASAAAAGCRVPRADRDPRRQPIARRSRLDAGHRRLAHRAHPDKNDSAGPFQEFGYHFTPVWNSAWQADDPAEDVDWTSAVRELFPKARIELRRCVPAAVRAAPRTPEWGPGRSAIAVADGMQAWLDGLRGQHRA